MSAPDVSDPRSPDDAPVVMLLGEVAVGAQPVRSSRVAGVLGLLVEHRGEVVRTEKLADELWNHHPPPTWANALRVHIASLRRLLQAVDARGALQSVPNGYRFDADVSVVDTLAFEHHVTRGALALDDGRPGAASRAFDAALALWRGEPFGRAGDLLALQTGVSRLIALRGTAQVMRLAARLELGEAASILPQIEQFETKEPYREDITLLRMRALAQLGRRAEALDAAHRLRVRLRRGLGLVPGPAIVTAELDLLRLNR